jgi:transposase
MVKLEEWMDIRALRKEGHSIKAIVRLTGRSRNTVRAVVREGAPRSFRKPRRHSGLDAFKAYVKERFESCRLSAVRLLGEIRPMGYDGSVFTLRRYLSTLRPSLERRSKLTVRFETAPGQQAQVDWAYCGRFTDAAGRLVSVYAFVMVLSFSRMLYFEFTTGMKLAQLIRSHLAAFDFFGGVTARLLYDNMKQVRLDRTRFHPLFVDFAKHYGFEPRTHAIRRPRTKGKVERAVSYVKDGFLNGRSFASFEELNACAQHWLAHEANTRIHGTTGRRPVDLWTEEKLTPLSSVAPYVLAESVTRKASWEGLVHFARSRYSVPPQYAGKTVTVSHRDQKVLIHCEDMLVAEHPAAPHKGASVVDERHLRELWKESVARHPRPLPSWKLTFDQPVATQPLGLYEQVTP